MIWMNQAMANSFMPTAGTEIAKQVDSLYGFLLVASFIACALLIGGMIYFVTKYKRKTDKDKTAYIESNHFLEFLWSFIPLVIFLTVFGWGWYVYHQMRTMPKEALEVHVFGKQWAWEVEYKNGYKAVNEIVVPVNRDVKLIMTSVDVLHSFYVPSFRIKQDVIPGRYTTLWFNANKLGDFHIFCAEYCGTTHSGMIATLKVVSQADFDKYLIKGSEQAGMSLAQKGAKLFQLKACNSCHSTTAEVRLVGPSLYKNFGREGTLSDGSKVKIDEAYLRESILNPGAKVVNTFPNGVMPAFQGQLSESDVNALIEYLKGL
jgi:cytochrome c oxidase subunit 2